MLWTQGHCDDGHFEDGRFDGPYLTMADSMTSFFNDLPVHRRQFQQCHFDKTAVLMMADLTTSFSDYNTTCYDVIFDN